MRRVCPGAPTSLAVVIPLALAVLIAGTACTSSRRAAHAAVAPTLPSRSATPAPRPTDAAPATAELAPAPIRQRPRPRRPAARRPLPASIGPTGRPPQFVVVSFDGAGSTSLFEHWRDAAAGSHFTFFLSGIYLVPGTERARYHGPHHRAGAADIKFFTAEHVAQLRGELASAYAEGHEIGTHFNGHFCGTGPGSVGSWTTADWTSELDQFDAFVTAAKLPFGPSAIVGDRTPCLEGRPDQLIPALAARHYRYDASGVGFLGRWPVRRGGLWEFPLQSVQVAGTNRSALAMDYNLYYLQSNAADGPPQTFDADQQQTLSTYENAFDRVYNGDRAPLFIGNHFEQWNGGAYTNALTAFIRAECDRPEVHCVSFRDLADWLDAQPPASIERLQALGMR